MRYAIALEKKFSKDEILLGYLNIAAFGGRVYGIESAAQYYFGGKHAADLTLAEAASLIAIVNHPEKFRLDYPESETNGANTVVDGQPVPYADNKERRDYILGEMLKLKKITQEEYDAAIATPVTPVITEPSTGCQTAGGSAYFCDYVDLDHQEPVRRPGHARRQRGRPAAPAGRPADLHDARPRAAEPGRDRDRRERAVLRPALRRRLGRRHRAAGHRPHPRHGAEQAYSNDPDVIATSPEYTSVNYSTDFEYGGSSGLQPGSTYKVFTLAEWLNEGHSLTETFNGSRRDVHVVHRQLHGQLDAAATTRATTTAASRTTPSTPPQWSVNTSFMAMAPAARPLQDQADGAGVRRAPRRRRRPADEPVRRARHAGDRAASRWPPRSRASPTTASTCTPDRDRQDREGGRHRAHAARDDLHAVGDPRGRAQHGLRDAEDVRRRRHGDRVRPRHRHRRTSARPVPPTARRTPG